MKSDAQLWASIKQSDQKAFKELFDRYFTDLVRFSAKLTSNPLASEEIVQDTFVYIWQKRHEIEINSGIKSYLFTATRNASFNFLKSRGFKEETMLESLTPGNDDPLSKIDNAQDFKKVVTKAIQDLPEACRTIFLLSRNFNFSNKEIAEELNISIKTVENQMTIALRKLREYLQKHWYIFLILFEKIFKSI